MSKYIFEMHAHTSEASHCAKVPGAGVVERCLKWGYSGIVITDHFSDRSFERMGNIPWEEKISRYLSGYRSAKAHAPKGFTVLLGAEVTNNATHNDYLIYGFDEDFLFESRDITKMEPESLRAITDKHGLFLCHAHPFRFGTTIVEPQLLDGIEVYNGSQKHNSDYDTANLWADRWGLIKLSGSDYHGSMYNGSIEDIAPGGVGFKYPVNTIDDVVAQLREKKHEVYHGMLG